MSPRIIELAEFEPRSFARDELDIEDLKVLHANYSSQIAVEAPSFLNNDAWRLTAQGWVGYIPLSSRVHISLAPKVPIQNIFGMLEYAYRLKGFKVLAGLSASEPISEMFDQVASILARRVLDRIRSGLYRSYLSEDDNLAFVRGRVNCVEHMRHLARVNLPCEYENHTADLEENQILLWTLTRILECGVCTDRSLPLVQQARRALQGFATTKPCSADQCVGRLYNRLNDDYEPLHGLCRFFLEQAGPTHRMGDRRMVPFLLDMDRLFELFVAEWLKINLPVRYRVQAKETVQLQLGQPASVEIDISVEDARTGQTELVLDTKYKADQQPSPDDMQQVVAYAAATKAPRAVLVYPMPQRKPICGPWGPYFHIESLSMRLGEDLDEAGWELVDRLGLEH